jgi:WD40 repeat protein
MGFYLNEIAISPDGASLLTIGTPVDKADTTMRLWRKGQDRPVAEIRIEADRIVAEARFDPTGRRIFVTNNGDGTMQVLSADTLDEVAQLPLGGIDPTTFAIGPDGTRILTETDGRLLLWRIEPTVDALVAEARNLLPRCLAVAERNLLQLDITTLEVTQYQLHQCRRGCPFGNVFWYQRLFSDKKEAKALAT